MSTQDYSKNGLLTFLRKSARSGILNPAVARSRKTAATHLLDHVSPDERLNLRLLDVDELCSRVHKLDDSSIRFEALELYNSRLKSALEDYFAWIESPENFVSVASNVKSSKQQKKVNTIEQKALEEITLKQSSSTDDIIPIKIRQELTVYIKDLPIDLTTKEADKIVRVIQAFANGESGE